MLKALLVAVLFAVAVSGKKGGRKPKTDFSDVVNPDPDAVNSQNSAEDNEGMTEGDIITNKNSNSEDRNAASSEMLLWPQGIVPYVLDRDLADGMLQKIDEAIKDFHEFTCMKFKKRRDEKDYIHISSKEHGQCYSNLGRGGGEQPLNLGARIPGRGGHCQFKGTVIHELMHAIGFFHEHRRSDRDDYITVHWNNIKKKQQYAYEKLSTEESNNQRFPYDFASIMHYKDTAFNNGGGKTMTAKNPKNQNKMGQRGGFSKQDIEEVNTLYKCRNGVSQVEGINGCTEPPWCENRIKQMPYLCEPDGGMMDQCAISCKQCSLSGAGGGNGSGSGCTEPSWCPNRIAKMPYLCDADADGVGKTCASSCKKC